MNELTLDSADGVDGAVGDEVSLYITGTITATGPDGVTVGEIVVDGADEAEAETEAEAEPIMPAKGKMMPKAVSILMMGKPKK